MIIILGNENTKQFIIVEEEGYDIMKTWITSSTRSLHR